MKHLILYAHPNPKSFNHAILNTTVETLQANHHEVVVRDLYTLGFDPVLKSEDFMTFQSGNIPADIKVEQDYISEADVITFIYPVWWTGLPALLKGYVDRVFSYGFAYAYDGEGNQLQLLKGKKGFTVKTHGNLNEYYDATGMTSSLIQTTDTGIFEFVGIEPVGHIALGGVVSVDDESRQQMLEKLKQTIATTFSDKVNA